MNARDLLSWLQGLTEEELELNVFAGKPDEDGNYDSVEKLAIVGTTDGGKAIFMEPLSEDKEADTEPNTDNN